MAISVKFDLTGNPEPSTIILAKRNGDRLGKLDVNPESISLSDKFNEASEISFTLNKYKDGELTHLWNEVVDFKLVECKEWNTWFEIRVELDEETETVKTVFCTQLGQAELSQIKLYDIHINDEDDIARDDYKKTILFNGEDTEASLLHRIFKDKAPHYSITHVDDTIAGIQRVFSFDDTDIHGTCMEVGEEIGCLFIFPSNSDANGKIQRTVEVYDLQQNCKNPECGYRGEFTDECPKCGNKDIKYGYGVDTPIFVTAEELAEGGIQFTTDTDSVKNCFKLEAGDDLMTATIRNCNPNGTDYIWYFSDTVKSDMSEELVKALDDYDVLYKEYYNNYESKLDLNIVEKYNILVDKYKDYYNVSSVHCLSCGYKGDFEGVCPECNSDNLLVGSRLEYIETPIIGYPALMKAYYDVVDFGLFLKSSLMPSIELGEKSLCLTCGYEGVFGNVCLECDSENVLSGARYQANLLVKEMPSHVGVNVKENDDISKTTAESAILSMAKIIVNPTYEVEIKTSTYADNVWEGDFKITNQYSDEEDKDEITSETIKINVDNDIETFLKQKIEKTLNKKDTENISVSGLFAEDFNVFCVELKKYALTPLKGFYDACDACLTILQNQDAGNEETKPDLYKNLYTPYYEKSQAIADEIKIREDEVNSISGVWDKTDKDNKILIAKGIQQYVEDFRNEIQDILNFQKYLEERNESKKNLWLEFCSYRREDKYSNDNYVSDGLNNADLFKKAMEFIDTAENEIYKSGELQHSISTGLKNLLAIPKFKSLVEHFNVGNWIRVRVDDKTYRLRLLEYEIDFGNFDSIPVTFSDVTKIKNGITDVQDILAQASSMATSYSSVQRQAEQGKKVQNTVEDWLVSGLNSAQVRIQNNTNEDVVLDENGLICRSHNDMTDSYDPEQFRITHNIMAYTSDNWNTVSSALGKHNYKYFNNNKELIDATGYGLSANFVTAGIVTGSQIIGGDIYSSNYPETDGEPTGSHLNLMDGTFSFAGGKLVYRDGDLIVDGKITVATEGTIGCWSVNKDSIYKSLEVYNGSEAFGNSDSMYFGVEGLSLGDAFQVTNTGVATMTEANVTGVINAEKGGTIADFVIDELGITNEAVNDEENSVESGNRIAMYYQDIGNPVTFAKGNYDTYSYYGVIRIGIVDNTNEILSYRGTLPFGINEKVVYKDVINITTNEYVETTETYFSGLSGQGLYIAKDVMSESDDNLSLKDGNIETWYTANSFGRQKVNVDVLGTSFGDIQDLDAECNIVCSGYIRSDEYVSTTEMRSPSAIYLKCNDATSNENEYTVKLTYGTVDSVGYGYFYPSYNTDSGASYTNLGDSNHKWRNVYATNGTISTSDRNLKKNIKYLDGKYIDLFDLINPVSYEMIEGDRVHTGFIAQDIEDAMIQVGLTSKDFGGLCKDIKTITDENGNEVVVMDDNGNKIETYSLRYNEFIALNTAKIKQLEQLVLQLQNEINKLKS